MWRKSISEFVRALVLVSLTVPAYDVQARPRVTRSAHSDRSVVHIQRPPQLAIAHLGGAIDNDSNGAAHTLEAALRRKLDLVSSVSLTQDVAQAGLLLDANVTRLDTRPADDGSGAQTECEVHALVATLPERSIEVTLRAWSKVSGTTDPADVESARRICLSDAAGQLTDKLESWFESGAGRASPSATSRQSGAR